MPNQIILSPQKLSGIEREDRVAGATITPGELLEIQTDNDLNAHQTAAANSAKIVALEPVAIEPASGTKQIDQDYSSGDLVRHLFAWRGAELYMWLDSSSSDVEAGDALESAGNGNLRSLTSRTSTTDQQTDSVVAYAHEDLAAPTSGRSRIKVTIA